MDPPTNHHAVHPFMQQHTASIKQHVHYPSAHRNYDVQHYIHPRSSRKHQYSSTNVTHSPTATTTYSSTYSNPAVLCNTYFSYPSTPLSRLRVFVLVLGVLVVLRDFSPYSSNSAACLMPSIVYVMLSIRALDVPRVPEKELRNPMTAT